ncbi:hypothetical protein XELAEV_18032778mg [Xenopus laevis]|uniref:Uncharacterized protein n=1 Tax=Xenopus laevis TaxID=8355 RepID=A0A974CI14_XENLA|nr:hypothetical protein XELAEV_18032778mg [Xenopus laevis]
MPMIFYACIVRLQDGLPLSASTDFHLNKQLLECKRKLKALTLTISQQPPRGTAKVFDFNIQHRQRSSNPDTGSTLLTQRSPIPDTGSTLLTQRSPNPDTGSTLLTQSSPNPDTGSPLLTQRSSNPDTGSTLLTQRSSNPDTSSALLTQTLAALS